MAPFASNSMTASAAQRENVSMTIPARWMASVVAALALWVPLAGQTAGSITTRAADGVTVHGEVYFGDLDRSSPLILLFHQGGSSGRGEYAVLAPWLNAAGFRAIAWDLRAGGELHGVGNRTAAGLKANSEPGFCDASPDLQAALGYVTARKLADRVILWGSSYSGALVFRLAAENAAKIAGVVVFSPASGPPMNGCQASRWLSEVSAPVAAFRPASEMARDSSVGQRAIFTAAGAEFRVVPDGVHGSSMLVDDRTGADMRATRDLVVAWLRRVAR